MDSPTSSQLQKNTRLSHRSVPPVCGKNNVDGVKHPFHCRGSTRWCESSRSLVNGELPYCHRSTRRCVVLVLRSSVLADFYGTKRPKSLRGVLGYPHGIGIKGPRGAKIHELGANFNL
jgi:hypothetical protein